MEYNHLKLLRGSDRKMIAIAVLGYGTIGSGVYEVIHRNQAIVARKAGQEIKIKHVLDLREFPGQPVQELITHNFEDIIQDEEVKVVVEVMGGVDVPYKFVKQALLKGKHVVTSNKALVAAHGPELLEIARQKKINFLFEASVGGGIPIIRPLTSCLTADKILEITGILNGTTNYILTEMTEKGKTFEEVLKVAQDLGYAEKDPTADIEGHDACRKIAILSSLAYGKTVHFEEIYTEGITKITAKDIAYAKKKNAVIKLVGSSKNTDKGISAMVAPVILSLSHPLSTVNGVFNAIFVKGNVLGDTMYYGSGAGSLPTASAVVADVVDAVRHINENIGVDWSSEKLEILDIQNVPVMGFIRVAAEDQQAAKDVCSKIFESSEFMDLEEKDDEFAVLTGKETEGSMKEKIALLKKEAAIKEVRNMIRMEG